MIGKLGTSPMKPCFHGSNRPFNHLGDLLVGEILLVEEDENQAVLGTKKVQRSFELSGKIIRIMQRWPMIWPVLRRLGKGWSASAKDHRRPTSVRGDAKEPGTDRPIKIEPGDSPDGSDECFLRDVFGIMTMAQHPKAKSKHDALKPFDQEARSLRIAGPERFDQRTVIHHSLPSLAMRANFPATDDTDYPTGGALVSEFVASPQVFTRPRLIGSDSMGFPRWDRILWFRVKAGPTSLFLPGWMEFGASVKSGNKK